MSDSHPVNAAVVSDCSRVVGHSEADSFGTSDLGQDCGSNSQPVSGSRVIQNLLGKARTWIGPHAAFLSLGESVSSRVGLPVAGGETRGIYTDCSPPIWEAIRLWSEIHAAEKRGEARV